MGGREKRKEPNMTDKKTIYDEAREMLEHAATGADEDESGCACDGAQEGEDGDEGLEELKRLLSLAGAFTRDSSAVKALRAGCGAAVAVILGEAGMKAAELVGANLTAMAR